MTENKINFKLMASQITEPLWGGGAEQYTNQYTITQTYIIIPQSFAFHTHILVIEDTCTLCLLFVDSW